MSGFHDRILGRLGQNPATVSPRPGSFLSIRVRDALFGFKTEAKPGAKNLISNSSGEHGYDGWTITKKGGSGWDIEKKPVFCSAVPTDHFLGVNAKASDTCCFVTSHGWSSKSYLVDLKQELSTLIATGFEIKCGQIYMSRGDCGGEFNWKLSLLDDKKNVLKEYNAEFKLPQQGDDNGAIPWKRAEYTFKFLPGDKNLTERITHLEFLHEGKDEKFWAGHYGMKFARSTVVVLGSKGNIVENAGGASTVSPKTENSSGPAKLPLKIRTLDGKTCNILAYTNWTVKTLKQEFHDCHGQKDAGTCTLQYKARILNDESVLGDLTLDPDSVLQANFTNKAEKPPVVEGVKGSSQKTSCKLVGNCVGVQKGTISENVPGIKRGCLMVARTDAENLSLGEVGLTCKIKGLGDTVFVGVKFRKQLALGSSGIKIEHVAGGDGYCDECKGRKYLYIPRDQIGDPKTHLFYVQ